MLSTLLQSERKSRVIFKARDQLSVQSVERFPLDIKDPVRNIDDMLLTLLFSKTIKKIKIMHKYLRLGHLHPEYLQ